MSLHGLLIPMFLQLSKITNCPRAYPPRHVGFNLQPHRLLPIQPMGAFAKILFPGRGWAIMLKHEIPAPRFHNFTVENIHAEICSRRRKY